MKRTTIKELFENFKDYEKKSITVAGWIKTVRLSKTFGFIELNDGSQFSNVQIVFDEQDLANYKEIEKNKTRQCLSC